MDLRLLSKVSGLYYEQNLTQGEIAERLRLSRHKVSCLLQQALDEGIVQVTVHSPPSVYPGLEEQIEQKFCLHEAVVVEVLNPGWRHHRDGMGQHAQCYGRGLAANGSARCACRSNNWRAWDA